MVADKALNVIERVAEKDADFVRKLLAAVCGPLFQKRKAQSHVSRRRISAFPEKRLNILLFEGAHQCTGPIDVDQRMLAAAP